MPHGNGYRVGPATVAERSWPDAASWGSSASARRGNQLLFICDLREFRAFFGLDRQFEYLSGFTLNRIFSTIARILSKFKTSMAIVSRGGKPDIIKRRLIPRPVDKKNPILSTCSILYRPSI